MIAYPKLKKRGWIIRRFREGMRAKDVADLLNCPLDYVEKAIRYHDNKRPLLPDILNYKIEGGKEYP